MTSLFPVFRFASYGLLSYRAREGARKPTLSIAPPLITHGRLFFPISLISKKPRPPRLRAWLIAFPEMTGPKIEMAVTCG